MVTRPFLRWAGGKADLADEILYHIGPSVLVRRKRYFEPFVGSAAMFWQMATMGQREMGTVLSDANAELVDCYRAIRDDVEATIGGLRWHADMYDRGGAEYYYAIRAESPSGAQWCRAARTIFLNKTCFNGLYRVNRSGLFNVPHGRTASGAPPTICDADNLRACSAALRGVEIHAVDFGRVVANDGHENPTAPGPDDLVYLDPPYEPEPGKASFTAYTATYGKHLQDDVARTFRELAARGVYVVASNSPTPRIRELYAGFRQIELYRGGGMNSDPTKRGKVKELLILGWP